MAWPRLKLDLTAGGGAAPKPRVGSPAFGKRGAVLIAATAGLASAADAVVVVENGHDRDATASTGLLQLKSPAKSVRLGTTTPRGFARKTCRSGPAKKRSRMVDRMSAPISSFVREPSTERCGECREGGRRAGRSATALP
jgi:hypothetical protein